MADKQAAVWLRAIAATAEAAATKLDRGQFWPGELVNCLGQIRAWLIEAEREAERG